MVDEVLEFCGKVGAEVTKVLVAALVAATLVVSAKVYDFLESAAAAKRAEYRMLDRQSELLMEQSIALIKKRAPVIKGPDALEPELPAWRDK